MSHKVYLQIQIPDSILQKKSIVQPRIPRASKESPKLQKLSIKSPHSNFLFGPIRPSFLMNSTKNKNDDSNLAFPLSNNYINEEDNTKNHANAIKKKRLNLEELSHEQLLELAISILQKAP